MLHFFRLCVGFLLVGLGACTNTNRFSYKQVNLSDEQIKEVVAKAPRSFRDSTITLALGPRYQKNAFHRWTWGKRNRELWRTPVTFPVLDLETEAGGLTPDEAGGGFQTKSLKLKDKQGNEYVIRSIDKEPIKTLPKFLQRTFLAGIVRDQTSAMNPYGPLVIPDLARAAGIYYIQPKYVYVPHDPRLGEYLKDYGGMIALFEANPKDDHPALKEIGITGEIDNTQEALSNIYGGHEYVADQRLFARARLFDIWIGDWDRHEGQWTWAEYSENGKKVYKPIPEDRDQVFYRLSDGWFSWLLTLAGPLRKLQTFDSDEIDVSSYIKNASFIDKRMLHKLSRKDWQEIADSLQYNLTDSVIASALRDLPDPVYKKAAPGMYAKLVARRKQLPEVAKKFYAHLAKKVEVPGSHKEERFVVTRLNDKETLVEVFALEDDKSKKKLYSRTFFRDETKEVTLYGLRGEDEFEISGEVDKGIRVNIVGGMGEDKVTDSSRVKGWSRKTKVYDTKHGIEINGSKETKVKTRKNLCVNAYDEEGL